MGAFYEETIPNLIISFLLLFVTVYIYYLSKYSYWGRRGVKTLGPIFPFGNAGSNILGLKSVAEFHKDLYNKFNEPYAGAYILTTPILLVKDPDLIKTILVKDFGHFHDRGIKIDEKFEPTAAHLFKLPGEKWRNLRHKLTPTFTSGKLKVMFQTLVDCGEELNSVLNDVVDKGGEFEVKDYAARYTTDIISSVAFGLQCNSLRNPDTEFRHLGKMIFEWNLRTQIINSLQLALPGLLSFLRIHTSNPKATKFMLDTVRETIKYREENHIVRNDFLQLLIMLKNKGEVGGNDDFGKSAYSGKSIESLTIEQLTAQAFVFFAAGFETSSTTISFCLYELSLNPDLQVKLQKEIDDVLEKHDGKITYDSIQEMDYLDNVMSETLRKYPPLGFLNRECTKEYTIPGTNVVLEKGTKIVISPLGLHNDPKYFPKPEVFDPDRFLALNKIDLHPYCYLPFGEGPRNCIGSRMGKMQVKIGIVSILKDYSVDVCENTDIPLKFDPKAFIMTPKNEICLKIRRR